MMASNGAPTIPFGKQLVEHLESMPADLKDSMRQWLTQKMTQYTTSVIALTTWSNSLPPHLKMRPENNIFFGMWVTGPILAWAGQQPWSKHIQTDNLLLYWRMVDDLSPSESMKICARALQATNDVKEDIPKHAYAGVLDFWLAPTRAIWKMNLSNEQASAWEACALLANGYPGKHRNGDPRKRWATNAEHCMSQTAEMFQHKRMDWMLESRISNVDKVRFARCCSPHLWERLAPKLLAVLPNNEWTRYDLLPMLEPSAKVSVAACAALNKKLACTYAPVLTHILVALVDQDTWANPAALRRMVDQTYRQSKGLLPKTKPELVELPDLDVF